MLLPQEPDGHNPGEPIITQTSSGPVFRLPDLRVFAYDPKTGNWSSHPQNGVTRQSDTAYVALNKIGYTFGGYQVPSEGDNLPDYNLDNWISTMSRYDFGTHEFIDAVEVPDDIGATNQAVMHSLDRVGHEGVLVVFAGKCENYAPDFLVCINFVHETV